MHPTREPCRLQPLPDRGAEEKRDGPVLQGVRLPPLGHGVGVNRVINPAMVLIGGHDTWRKRKGHFTPQHARGLPWLCALPQGSGTRKGNPPDAAMPAHAARCRLSASGRIPQRSRCNAQRRCCLL